MAAFRMPSLGADMDAATLVEWLVKPGDRVERGQIIAVVETQKGAIDIETFAAGVVESLLVEVGKEVPVGTVLAEIRTDTAQAESPMAPAPTAAPQAEPAAPVVAAPALETKRASPRARKRAAELGVDLAQIVGTGEGGAITTDDVARAAAEPTHGNAGMRQAIAAAMSRSKREIPHYYLWHAVDLEPALQWLEATNAALPVASRVLPAIMLVRAVALALRELPELGSTWVDGRAVPPPGIHVGFAISLRDGGLVNPALHDCDRGSLVELMQRARDVTDRARHGGLRASELSDAVITVTNLGELGTDGVLGVIHPPQTAIVGFGAITARPWVVDNAVVVRRVVEVSLSADHRVSDGHRGARFLRAIERILHNPEGL
jgi:pyruvate dehydrogenase E2 component (dihydrolipoamide acetyltransferase)